MLENDELEIIGGDLMKSAGDLTPDDLSVWLFDTVDTELRNRSMEDE